MTEYTHQVPYICPECDKSTWVDIHMDTGAQDPEECECGEPIELRGSFA